jgi:hypothetical protein
MFFSFHRRYIVGGAIFPTKHIFLLEFFLPKNEERVVFLEELALIDTNNECINSIN